MTRPLPPGPRGGLLLGSMSELRRDPLAFFVRLGAAHGEVVYFRMGPLRIVLVNGPDAVRHVLLTHHRNYHRNRYVKQLLLPFLGEGLLTLDGDAWLVRRRLAQPAFHREKLAAMTSMMAGTARELLPRWEQRAARREPVDLAAELLELSLRVTLRGLCSGDLEEHLGAIRKADVDGGRYFADRSRRLLAPPLWVPTAQNRAFRGARRALRAILLATIAARQRQGAPRADLLGLLMETRDAETGAGLEAEAIANEMITSLLAGHETTALAVAWAFYLLDRHPEVDRALRAELARVVGARPVEGSDLPRLPLLKAVLEEALRLYPPAWAIGRTSVAEDEIGGFRIPAGVGVNIIPYALHRNARLWEDPERFDPERFTPEAARDRAPFSYIPFGGGPHQCIGAGFALLSAQLSLATIAQRFRPRVVDPARVVPDPLIALNFRHGLAVELLPA